LLELGARVIVALNMVDVALGRGIEIDVPRLSQALGVRIVETNGISGAGVDELRRAAHDLARGARSRPLAVPYGHDLEAAIGRLTPGVQERATAQGVSGRWLALKLLESDEAEAGQLTQDRDVLRDVQAVRAELARHFGYDVETAIVEQRYGFLNGVVRECVRRRPDLEDRLSLTDGVDSVVTNRWLGIPVFLFLMWVVFQLVFTVGTPISDLVGKGFHLLGLAVAAGLSALHAPAWLGSLVSDGLIDGVGSVLTFVPNIVILFLIISLLEDSGYMARAAFVMDRFMHFLGLHGKSFIPMIVGFGCNVPAIMATRTLESRKDRILTILVNPLMSCSARLPIYILFTGAFFTRQRGFIVFSLYLLGIVLAVLTARVFKWLFFREEVAPLIMELPPYHRPQLRATLQHVWDRSSMFVRKAGTVIAAAVAVIWLLGNLPWGVAYASEASLLGRIGALLVPVLKPAGFGYWWAGAALLAGVVAKEIVVGTMGTVFGVPAAGLSDVLRQYFTPLSAYAFMVMCLIYIPCISTVAAIRRETNWRWTILAVGYTLVLGWLVATVVYQLGRLLS
jgi:ferrous iron transport protein B